MREAGARELAAKVRRLDCSPAESLLQAVEDVEYVLSEEHSGGHRQRIRVHDL